MAMLSDKSKDLVIKWLLGGGSGVSSRTIVSAILKIPFTGADVPHDPSDFGRCHRLLAEIPELKQHLPLVAKKYKAWTKVVENWDRLTEIYLRDLASNRSNELFRLLRGFREDEESEHAKWFLVSPVEKREDRITDFMVSRLPPDALNKISTQFKSANKGALPKFIFLVEAGSLVAREDDSSQNEIIVADKVVSLHLDDAESRIKFNVVGCNRSASIQLQDGVISCNTHFDVSFKSKSPAKKPSP